MYIYIYIYIKICIYSYITCTYIPYTLLSFHTWSQLEQPTASHQVVYHGATSTCCALSAVLLANIIPQTWDRIMNFHRFKPKHPIESDYNLYILKTESFKSNIIIYDFFLGTGIFTFHIFHVFFRCENVRVDWQKTSVATSPASPHPRRWPSRRPFAGENIDRIDRRDREVNSNIMINIYVHIYIYTYIHKYTYIHIYIYR